MNELQVLVKQVVGTISFNYEEMKQQALDITKKYGGLVLTEDDVAPAKKDRAELNHKFDDLETRRKEIEKTHMATLDDFKVQIKEVGKIFADASETIDKQIKVFDEAKRLEKKHEIEKIFAELVRDMADYLPLGKIYDTRWENVAITMKSIQSALEQLISSTALAVNTIKDMDSEYSVTALEQYKVDLSLAGAISYVNKQEALKAEILAKEAARHKAEEDRKAEEERERIRREERQRSADEERIRSEERAKAGGLISRKPEPVLADDDFEDAPPISERPFIPGKAWATYEILCSTGDLETIDAFLKMSGIGFRRA